MEKWQMEMARQSQSPPRLPTALMVCKHGMCSASLPRVVLMTARSLYQYCSRLIFRFSFSSFRRFLVDAMSSASGRHASEPSTLPYIASIDIRPAIRMSPAFSPLVTTYNANVSFEQILIRVFALSENCQSEVRLEGKYGSSRLVRIPVA